MKLLMLDEIKEMLEEKRIETSKHYSGLVSDMARREAFTEYLDDIQQMHHKYLNFFTKHSVEFLEKVNEIKRSNRLERLDDLSELHIKQQGECMDVVLSCNIAI